MRLLTQPLLHSSFGLFFVDFRGFRCTCDFVVPAASSPSAYRVASVRSHVAKRFSQVGYLSSGKEGTQTSFLEINVVEDALKHAEDTVWPNNNRYL